MKMLSEFIEQLQELKREHGDVQVCMEDDTDPTADFYPSEDDDTSDAVVIA